MRPSIHEWHSFTRIWVANVRHLQHDPNYCRLAVAMAAADDQRWQWDHYLNLAIQCKTHFDEMEAARLQQRRATAEAHGWDFEFTGHGWLVTTPEIEIRQHLLTAALGAVEAWGAGHE